MEKCKICLSSKFIGKWVSFNKPFPNNNEFGYSRFVVRCENGHLIGAYDKEVDLSLIKTHHTVTF